MIDHNTADSGPKGITRALSGPTLRTALCLGAAAAAGACGAFDSSKSSSDGTSGSGARMTLNEVSNGFGQLLPHTVLRLDNAGLPTNELVTIRNLSDISSNVRRNNPVSSTVSFPTEAIEPDNTPGNHYFLASFTQTLDPLTVLNPSPTNAGLSGAVSVTTINPQSGVSLSAQGRAFVGGKTLVGPPVDGQLQLQQWVVFNEDTGVLEALVPEAQGFPGVGTSAPNARTLVADSSIVFVADTNQDLLDFETFPQGVQIRFRVTTALTAANGETLTEQVLASTTVGLDELAPEILTTPPPAENALITPGGGDTDVDPTTQIRFEFTEPVQPYSMGAIYGQPNISTAVQITFGPETSTSLVPFTVLPISPFDLSTFLVTPGFSFPGEGPEFLTCGTFSRVDVVLATNQIEDLAQVPSTDPNQPGVFNPNLNVRGADTFFETGTGPGVVNAPVAPDAIYVGRSGAASGLSVIDLCGFGQSTGNPVSSTPFPLAGESRFPYDPNVTQNASIRPLLTPGECTIDGGSAGVFTLTLDSSLEDLVVRSPLLSSVTDAHIGHALDGTFRNAPPPFGCQSGGGNVCALDGIKIISTAIGNQPNTLAPAAAQQFGGGINPGYENIISWAPHPNPPGIAFPPQCVSPFLAGEEPSSIFNPPAGIFAPNNLLVTGNPFPVPSQGSPPTGLLTLEQNQFFIGPTFGQTQSQNCAPYQIRQQIGHFLYVADRPRNEIVVLNSNRMTVVERIQVSDPTALAMGPNVDLLAISNQLADTVTFVDVNPSSAQFHKIISVVEVENSPRGIAFEPTNEDCVVCNELDNSISIIAASNLLVRRSITSQLNRPFELALTPRMIGFSFNRAVYFGYVLNRTGNMALFESGPNGVNGWGYDDVVGILPFDFQAPKTVQLDPINQDASVYVVHEGAIDPVNSVAGPLGEGAISRLRIESAITGAIPLTGVNVINSNFRDMAFSVPLSLSQSEGQLSGIPIDIAFDNQRNLGGLPGPATNFSAGSPVPANSKASNRVVVGVGTINTSEPQFLFAAVPNPVGGSGVVDVLALGITGTPRFDVNPYRTGVQSIPVPQVATLSDYFRE